MARALMQGETMGLRPELMAQIMGQGLPPGEELNAMGGPPPMR